MFQGYTDETFEFFMAIRFNNNRDFFQGSHDWYLRAVREPSLRLAEALDPVIEAMDENLERRANRVVSRINRDLRFSRDKSPYRDYIWLAWRVPGEQRSTTLGVYFDISDQGSSYGMGYYEDNRPLMNALRRRMASEPEAILEAMSPIAADFSFTQVRPIKRIAIPDSVPEALRVWYPTRGFYFSKDLNDFSLLKSAALVDELSDGFRRMTPLYRYIRSVPPEADEDRTVERDAKRLLDGIPVD